MHYHSQNLNDPGRKLWHGRAWLHFGRPYESRLARWEWSLGRKSRDFALWLEFGNGDDDAGLLFHLCIPFLFSIFIGIDGIYRCRECKLGVAIHNVALWFYTLSLTMDSPMETDVWWRKTHSWAFPWSLEWHSTEILEHGCPQESGVVWRETVKNRKDWLKHYDERKRAEASVSKVYPYTYTRKNGQVQERTAAVFVDRMEWRARWWPIIPIKNVRQSINVAFNEEVGEGVDTWKGGVTGCGCEMRAGETPLETLRRMERERRFDR